MRGWYLHVAVASSLYGLAPPYLYDDCLLVAEVGGRLRSADARTCVVPRTSTQFFALGVSHVIRYINLRYLLLLTYLVTGVLLWLVRGSGTVIPAPLHDTKASTASESC